MVALTLLLTLIVSQSVAAATTPTAQYSINVTSDAVSVSLNLNMIQNVTVLSFEKSFTLPSLHVSAQDANSSVVQAGLRLKNPKAQVNNMNLRVDSSQWSNKTRTQWLNMSMSFSVSGVSVSHGQTVSTDLSWKSFTVSSGYLLGGVEVNRIGEKYLAGVAADLAAHSSGSSFIQIFYEVNGVSLDSSQFEAAVRNMSVWDFSAFATPVSKWQESHTALAGESWSLIGGRGLGMDYIQEINEGNGVLSRVHYGLFYDLTGMITTPFGARVSGDTVTQTVGGLTEAIAAGTIVSTVALGSGAYLFERRIQGKTRKKKPTR